MNCPQNAQLHRYHDKQLSAEQMAVVEAHLQSCGECRDELQAMRRVSRALTQASMAQPSERMMRQWARSVQSQRDRQIRHLAEWAMAAAAAIVLGIFGLWPEMDAASVAQAQPLLGNVEQAMLVNPGEDQLPANLVTARLIAADLSGNAATTVPANGSQTP